VAVEQKLQQLAGAVQPEHDRPALLKEQSACRGLGHASQLALALALALFAECEI
jgi:hypothetical protein